MIDTESVKESLLLYSFYFDYFLSHSKHTLRREFLSDQLLDGPLALNFQQLQIKLWSERDPVLLSIIVNGFCKLLFNNNKILKLFGVTEEEVFVSLLILWRSKVLTNQDKFHLSSKQILDIFFSRLSNLNEKSYRRVFYGFISFFELLFKMEEKKAHFVERVIETNDFAQVLVKSLLRLLQTLDLDNIPKSSNWRLEHYFDFDPQQFIFMFLLTKNYQGMAMEILSEIQTYIRFDNLKDICFQMFVEEELG